MTALGHLGALAGWSGLVVAGSVLPFLARAEMWRACLPPGTPRATVLRWSAAAYALNQLVGFRSGDLARAALAARACGVTAGALSVGALRAAELAAVVLWAVAAGASSLPIGRACALGAAALGALGAAALVAARWRRGAGAGVRVSAGLLCGAVVLPLLEVPLVIGVAGAVGEPLGLAEAAVLVAAGTIGQAAALLPLNAVTVEASFAGALALLGRDGSILWTLPLALHAARLALAVCLLPAVVSSIPFSELKTWAIARR